MAVVVLEYLVMIIHVFSVQMIETLGGTTRLAELGMQTLEDGTQLPLPPVLLGHIGQDPHKKTVLIYGHLDVQPAKKVSLLSFSVDNIIDIIIVV